MKVKVLTVTANELAEAVRKARQQSQAWDKARQELRPQKEKKARCVAE